MRHLDPPGAQLHRQIDHRRHAAGVVPVDHRIDGQRQPGLGDAPGSGKLAPLRSLQPADALAPGHVHVLDADLHVLQAGIAASVATSGASSITPEVIRLV